MLEGDKDQIVTKSKKRNAEKRKAKSRDAARSRRSKEADVFSELTSLVPVPDTTVATMDKSSVMRVAISHLKIRTLMNGLDALDTDLQHKMDSQYLKTLNGFLVIMDKEGDMVYVSENIVKHLGLTQIEMIGQNVFEFSHPCDHEELHEVLDEKHADDHKDDPFHTQKTFFARLKCTLTSKGRNVNLKSATYKVIRFRGHRLSNNFLDCWVWICESIPHPSHMDLPLDSYAFLTRQSLDMKICYCEDRIKNLLGYDSKAMLNKSLFEFHHALDGEYMDKIYKDLHSKGQVWTDHYRFLAKGGGYAWMETQATVVHNAKTERPQYIVCVHFVLSGIEDPDVILSEVQQPNKNGLDLTKPMKKAPAPEPKGPIASTQTIFVPRTKAMDQGVCAPKRKLKEEADIEMGLIAPTAGDEITPVKFDAQDSEMVALLKDVLIQAMDLENKTEQPMFMSMDEKESENREKAPEIPNLEHLADKPFDTSRQRKQTSFIDTDEIDYEMRAPYIPMSGEEDLLFQVVQPVPLCDDSYKVPVHMLGTTESVFSPMPEDPNTVNKNLPVPKSIRRQEAMQKQEKLYTEMEHKKVTVKVRQPVETNRLETGPPAYKRFRMEDEGDSSSCCSDWESDSSPLDFPIPKPTTKYTDINTVKGSTVLKNLLLSGHDSSGYDIQKYEKPQKKLLAENSTLRGLLTGPIDYTPPDSPPRSAYASFQVSAQKPQPSVSPKLATVTATGNAQPLIVPNPSQQSAKITVKAMPNAASQEMRQEQIVLSDEMIQMLFNYNRPGKVIL